MMAFRFRTGVIGIVRIAAAADIAFQVKRVPLVIALYLSLTLHISFAFANGIYALTRHPLPNLYLKLGLPQFQFPLASRSRNDHQPRSSIGVCTPMHGYVHLDIPAIPNEIFAAKRPSFCISCFDMCVVTIAGQYAEE